MNYLLSVVSLLHHRREQIREESVRGSKVERVGLCSTPFYSRSTLYEILFFLSLLHENTGTLTQNDDPTPLGMSLRPPPPLLSTLEGPLLNEGTVGAFSVEGI